MPLKIRHPHSQRGNALFMILLAVALFAALNYAVTSSMRGDGKSASEERMSAALAEIQQVVAAHRAAVNRMILSGVDPTLIDPRYTGTAGAGSSGRVNAACTVPECRLYDPAGGGLTYHNFYGRYPELSAGVNSGDANKPGWSSWGMSGGAGDSTKQIGTPKSDLLYNIMVSRAFCDFVNLKMSNAAVDSHTAFGSSSNPSSLAFVTGAPVADSVSGFAGNHGSHINVHGEMGCWYSTNSGGVFVVSAPILIR